MIKNALKFIFIVVVAYYVWVHIDEALLLIQRVFEWFVYACGYIMDYLKEGGITE